MLSVIIATEQDIRKNYFLWKKENKDKKGKQKEKNNDDDNKCEVKSHIK